MARKKGWVAALGNALTMSVNMAAAIAVGYFGGKYLDKWLGTEPWLTMLMFLLGVATGLKMVYNQAFNKWRNPSEASSEDKESDSNIKVQPSKEIIDTLRAARAGLKDIEAQVRKIHPRDEDDAKRIGSEQDNEEFEKEDGPK